MNKIKKIHRIKEEKQKLSKRKNKYKEVNIKTIVYNI